MIELMLSAALIGQVGDADFAKMRYQAIRQVEAAQKRADRKARLRARRQAGYVHMPSWYALRDREFAYLLKKRWLNQVQQFWFQQRQSYRR